jgi:hypothetical protein
MTGAPAPAVGADLETGADDLRDAIAAIRCAWCDDAEGLAAITTGTTAARRVLGTVTVVAVVTGCPGIGAARGDEDPVTADGLRLVDALRAGGVGWHVAINTVDAPRAVIAALATVIAAAGSRAGLEPSALEGIRRRMADGVLDVHLEELAMAAGREVMPGCPMKASA